MGYSIIQGLGDGVTTQFAINFPLGFLSRNDVTFWVVGEVDGSNNPIYRPITWINDGLISIAVAPVLNAAYEIIRTVDPTVLVHTYVNGEPIEEENLDDSNKQCIMLVQEVLDGRFTAPLAQNLNMGNNRIVNMADGIAAHDAVTKEQLDAVATGATGGYTLLAQTYATQAAASAAAAAASAASIGVTTRTKLSGNLTYYVRPGGNDSHTGLVNDDAHAFLTIQHAINAAYLVDSNQFNITIQIAAGTYTGQNVINGALPGNGALTITGDIVTPSNVVINSGAASCITALNGANVNVQGMKFTGTTGLSGGGLVTQAAQIVVTENVEFGANTNCDMLAYLNGNIQLQKGYTKSGNSAYHVYAQSQGIITSRLATVGSPAITITGTPAFSGAFAYATNTGIIELGNQVYTGAATGTRYSSNNLSLIDAGGHGANFFPGNGAGSTSNGGQYV